MRDIQDQEETRGIGLDQVGLARLAIPIRVLDRDGRAREATATVSVFVALPAGARAVHMSRFLEALAGSAEPLDRDVVRELLANLRSRHDAPGAGIEMDFPFSVTKTAPTTGSSSALVCRATVKASLADSFRYAVGVRVPVMMVCPCSVGAAGRAGLAQRGYVSVSVEADRAVRFEDLVDLVESCASAPVRALLKAADERALLESAVSRPFFVEDIVRNVTQALEADPSVDWYSVEAENLEGAHDHSTFASREHRRAAG